MGRRFMKRSAFALLLGVVLAVGVCWAPFDGSYGKALFKSETYPLFHLLLAP